MNILIIRLSSLGDIIHTFPMIHDIKVNFPEAQIDWLVDSSFEELVIMNPNINQAITIPLREWSKNKFTMIYKILSWGNKYRTHSYDYIIDAQGLIKSAVLNKFFKGDTYGFDKTSIREKLASIFYKHKIVTGKNHLAIQKNRVLAANIFKYNIIASEVKFGLINSPKTNNSEPYAIFFHATSKNSKKYPTKQWIELAKYLITIKQFKILLPFGNKTEQQESEEIKSLLSEYSNFIEIPQKRLNYFEISKLIINADFIFGVDTGLVHLSNAFDKKLIAIYTDTNPEKTGVFETNIAKNIGGIAKIPETAEVINLFENILSSK
jgi:heptosyltransferase I